MNSFSCQTSREIFILDDDADVRETLCLILDGGGHRGVCFADEESLLKAMRLDSPIAIFLDVNLPGRSGLDTLKDLSAYAAPVLMISGVSDIATAVTAMKYGARDFIQKPFKGRDILDNLEAITASVLLDSRTNRQKTVSSFNLPESEPLTRREREVLQLVATGSSNKQIGVMLSISYRTVEEHRSNIMRKLGVKNVAELLIAVLK